MMNTAFISLGSNIGDRFSYLQDAIEMLSSNKKINMVNYSSVYETDPVGYEDQDRFLNMVIQVDTELSPYELLEICLAAEQELGRKRLIKWGPRTIDLDILLYNQDNIESEKLTVPHPRIQERAFVMIPLLEIKPDITLPAMDMPLCILAEEIPDKKGVQIWKRKNGEDAFALFES
ncbi:2-amino-4-hydroxy-6-hydroxymethyldihydropteridine diphosphokinase [Cytobacillus gottheilii]|uniref:2-amino-4-hydroxy-6- hydroxymethyldihydropteridine diphosphokinase n=1 Tax=Cytobacillus gottheilii TaxID=859144 RepID=UPI0024942335|nr:2-amino-4-hydroxy-6-hydroxymethyldihydropteridine diphosphokinase [Cytobacillus gottheilii]